MGFIEILVLVVLVFSGGMTWVTASWLHDSLWLGDNMPAHERHKEIKECAQLLVIFFVLLCLCVYAAGALNLF